MKASRIAVCGLIFAMTVVLSRRIMAQVSSSCPEAVSSPRDLAMELTVNGGQSVFQQGEIIPLRVRCSSGSKSKYLFNNRNYDRSGRLDGPDSICIQPNPGTDPLDDYFHSYGGFMGGGLFSEQQVTAKPISTALELNEWVTLPPGEYRLRVLSKRISLGSEGNYKTWDHASVPVQSDWISFRITKPEPAWQLSTLRDATTTLDSASSTPDQEEHAARVLRFLNSEDAARDLARRFWKSEGNLRWNFEAGLYGTPFRRTAIQEMKTVLRESRDGTRDWFIDVLVNLEMQSDPRFRQLRYGTQLADREKNPGSSYDREHRRRAIAYASGAASGMLK